MTPQEQKLNKLESLLKLVDESITKEEFVKSFESILLYVKKIKEGNIAEMSKMMAMIENKLRMVRNGVDGRDGKDGLNGRDGKDGLGLDGKDGKDGKNGRDGKDGSPDTPKQVRDKLETLKGNERLDKSAIKGLEELEDKVKNSTRRPLMSFGGRSRTFIRSYRLTGQCNGVLKAFTLPSETLNVVAVFGTQFPVTFDPLDDWTFAGRTLTLGASVSAPEAGQTLWALIEVPFYY